MTQERLAQAVAISQAALSMIENDRLVPGPETVGKLCQALRLPGLMVPRAPLVVPGRRLIPNARFRSPPLRPEISLGVRISQARLSLGRDAVDEILRQFRSLPQSRAWESALRHMGFDSGIEVGFGMRLLIGGLELTRLRLSRIGFPWPIVDPRTGVFTGLCSRWSFVLRADGVVVCLTPGVTVQLRHGRRRLDLAGVARVGGSTWFFDLELDGRQHLGAEDEDWQREAELDLPTLRIPQDRILSEDPSQLLRAFAAGLPVHPRARGPLRGAWL